MSTPSMQVEEQECVPKVLQDIIHNYGKMLRSLVQQEINSFKEQILDVHRQALCTYQYSAENDSGLSSLESFPEPQPTTSSSSSARIEERHKEIVQQLDLLQYGQSNGKHLSQTFLQEYRKLQETSTTPLTTWKAIRAENRRKNGKGWVECAFCRKNGEMAVVFRSHSTKDNNGDVVCPILQRYICELCGATGRFAHTRKYCPEQKEEERGATQRPRLRVLANGVVSSKNNYK